MSVVWRPARSIIKLRDQLNAAYPNRPTASDGILASAEHTSANPDSDHEPRIINGENVVCAIDITAAPWTQTVVDALVASRDPRIKYLIWNRRFCAGVPGWGSAPWTWVPYTGINPHTLHFHLSVSASNCDLTNAWHIGEEDDMQETDFARIAKICDAAATNAAIRVWSRFTHDGKSMPTVIFETADNAAQLAAATPGTSPAAIAADEIVDELAARLNKGDVA